MADIYRLSGWGYALDNVDPLRFSVHPPLEIKTPPRLMKYYRVNIYSIDSILNSFLYASHPFELNDPFDCFHYLIDYNNVTLLTYKRFFCTFASASERYIDELYRTKPEILDDYFKTQLYNFLFSRLGIISLTNNELDMLMWAHYSNHNGFLAIYDVPILQNEFHGPFPINYVNQAESFNININPHLGLLYLTNIKSQCWSYENEWRFIAESIDPMILPNRYEKVSLRERKFTYQVAALKEIVLGFNFFPQNSFLSLIDEKYVFDFASSSDGELRYKVLNFVIEKNIPISLIHLYDNLEFKLSKREIHIEKLENMKISYQLK